MAFKAVTFDFYNTLVYHRRGIGRGKQYQNYLSAVGLSFDPWQHQVLYDVFDYYGSSYSPAFSDGARLSFWTEFTRRLFERTNVRGSRSIDHAEHAQAIREIMGPNCFALFDDSLQTLRALRKAGFRLGVISDWQRGLTHFCEELGIRTFLDVIVTSGEEGFQKPDPRLFDIARERMGISSSEILHVGDLAVDVEGARAAGYSVLLLVRSGESAAGAVPVIRNLDEVLSHAQATPG
jgi:HAD superfamily hydrolase (TIGR01549 family)